MLDRNANPEPKLGAPGAGVPLPQKLIMKFYIRPYIAGRTPWKVSEEKFHRTNEKIIKELEGLNDPQLLTRILVPKQVGLEDSSRYWSITMVLEHLTIVSTQMIQLIVALSKGSVPEGEANTAQVKPHIDVDLETTLEKFKKLISTDFEKLNASVQNPANTNARFMHPWFGAMNAQEWYWLLATHHGLHLKQIREIKKGLQLF